MLAALALAGCSSAGDGRGEPAGAHLLRELRSAWSALPAPPAARQWAVRVWTGRELFLWGGSSRSDARLHANGFAYHARSRHWRRVAAGPLPARSSAAAVWTGAEVLIWGDVGHERLGDGASLDPRSGVWRALPPAALSPREPAVAAWTGSELVLWGDSARTSRARDGAAYDPARRRWRQLARAPFALNQASAAWIGQELIVLGAQLDGRNRSRHGSARVLAYDPRRNRWRRLPRPRLSPQASSIGWTGEQLLAWDYELRARTYHPDGGDWRRLPRVPAPFGECYPATVGVYRALLAWYCGRGALFDPARRAWVPVAPAPRTAGGAPVGGGRVALFPRSAGRPMLWAYRPHF